MVGIVNARIETVSDGVIDEGQIVISEGKIFDIGTDVNLDYCSQIIDARGRTVTPGIIDAHTHIGLHEQGIGWEGNDVNEAGNPVAPWCRARDGINMLDEAFEMFRQSGITSIGVFPGSANVVGGTGIAIKCCGTIVDEAVIKDPVGMKVALGENPKRVYGEMKKTPSTRMANAAVLRDLLTRTKYYLEAKSRGKNGLKTDRECEAMIPVIKKEIPLIIHCHRHDDIVTAVRICREFDVKFVLEHVTDGYMLVDFLKEQDTHCALGPLLSPHLKVENCNGTFRTPVYFAREGVPFCLITDHPVISGKNIILTAAIAIQWGLSHEDALRAITLEAARHLGIDDRVGSLEKGKDADLVIWSDDPFEFTTFVDITIINGEIVYKR